MIQPDDTVFPNNVVQIFKSRLGLLDADLYTCSRPLRKTDPTQSIGVYASLWTPDDESWEMGGQFLGSVPAPQSEPTLSSYTITIQGYILDMDEERGLKTHAALSKLIRGTLHRDQPLRVALAQLSSSSAGSTERFKRHRVRTQRFNSNELDGNWLFLSTTEVWVETETI